MIAADRSEKLRAIQERASNFDRIMQTLPPEQVAPTLIEGSHMWGDMILDAQDAKVAEKLTDDIIKLVEEIDFATLTTVFCGLIALSVEGVFPGPFGRAVAVGGISKIIGRMVEQIIATRLAEEQAKTATKQ